MRNSNIRPRIDIVAAALPPALDGIGDYSANLVRSLVPFADVGVLTAVNQEPAPIAGARVRRVFALQARGGLNALRDKLLDEAPDWVIVQYNPFCFGRWGLNVSLPAVVADVRRRVGCRVAVVVHEAFVPFTTAKFAIMSLWQRPQFWRLGRAADVMFFSVGLWAERFRPWFPNTRIAHLPVGSNVGRVPIGRDESRARLGIGDGAVVLGLFGTAHTSRLFHLAAESAADLRRAGHDPIVLYVGPDAAAVRAAVPGVPVIADGALPPDEISRRFAAMDVYLAALIDGVSTRRTTLMTALQHGIATVGTHGSNTDPCLLAEHERSMLLAPVDKPQLFVHQVRRAVVDVQLRRRLARAAEELYEAQFAWPVLSARMLATLRMVADRARDVPRPPCEAAEVPRKVPTHANGD